MTIVGRLETLNERLETLHGNSQQLLATAVEQSRQIEQLRLITEQHGQELRRFHRALKAALEAYLNDDDNNQTESR